MVSCLTNLNTELLKVDKRAVRQQQVVVAPVSIPPPKPVATKTNSPVSIGSRKFFTPPLPRPITSSPIQRPVRPALVYADEEDAADVEDERPHVRHEEIELVPQVNPFVEEEEDFQVNDQNSNNDSNNEVQDLFVLDFDMPNHYQNNVPEQMDIDTAEDDSYDFDAFQRASAMYPSTSGNKAARPNHLSAVKRKNNLADFIQVTPRGRAAPTKPTTQAQQNLSNTQQATSANNASTMRAPIGPSFSTYRYKQTAKKSANTSAAGDVLGCCSDHKRGSTVRISSPMLSLAG
jgi:hypothetical protein